MKKMNLVTKFLNKDDCKFLISYFDNNEKDTKKYFKRKVMRLLEKNHFEKNDIKKYCDLYNNFFKEQSYYLQNIEIAKWPIGEEHPTHTDDRYYKYQSKQT